MTKTITVGCEEITDHIEYFHAGANEVRGGSTRRRRRSTPYRQIVATF